MSGALGLNRSLVQNEVYSNSVPVLVMLCVHIVGMSTATGESPSTSKSKTSSVNSRRSEILARCGEAVADQAFELHRQYLASLHPARLIHKDDEIGSIVVGKRADLVLLDEKLLTRRVFVDGHEITSH